MSVVLQGLRLPLAGFTLEVDAVLGGRVTALFGASGAGKTTLLEIVAGLRRPAAGRVCVGDRVLTDVAARVAVPPARRAVGYVPQDGALFPHLSVRENLRYGMKSTKEGGQTAGLGYGHVLEVLEIGALEQRAIRTLSGGEKQRVALGRALLAAPRLLLLDEPLAGLDAPLKERLLSCLVRVRDEFGVPMLCVTHAPDEVMALCDDALVLAAGKVIRRGAPADLFVAEGKPSYRLRD